ncbi:MAG: endolytic transglycosylase MltG [Patescibacteria group bacterium]|nr:endolytic transglycosylase MltG [Patescibacteria group bacterium]
MLKLIKIILGGLVIVFLIAYFLYSNAVNKPVNNNSQDVLFVIASGESVDNIANNLYAAGIIKSDFYFKLYVWRQKMQASLQAGDYFLSPRLSIAEIVERLASGEAESRERNLKIIEGWTINDINDYLAKNDFVISEDFFVLAKAGIGDWKLAHPTGELEIDKFSFFLGAPHNVDLEGYLFPDTYRIYSDASAEDIIAKALNNFDIKLSPDLREVILQQNKSIHEIITMASIIEKEVSAPGDRKLVSGIFWKRIALGMPLQADSTVNYVTRKNTPAITLEDREIDSLFNTYKYSGLPPGPICNPGLGSIKAAIYPEDSRYLYYLNRLDTGETIFSQTYEKHVANKNKYLK